MPKLPPVTEDEQKRLDEVTAAVETKNQAEDAYRETVLKAHQAGIATSRIAKAAGVSTQSAWLMIQRHTDA